MRKVIRRGCFESNSSSAHSICVTKNDIHLTEKDFVHNLDSDDPYPDDYVYAWDTDGSWHLWHVEDGFGRWPFQMLTTFSDKFRYALCEYCGRYYGDEPEFEENLKMFEDLAKEIVPGVQKLKISTKELDIYRDEDGNELLHRDLEYDGYNKETHEYEPIYVYVDSTGNKHKAICDEEEYLEVEDIGFIDHQSSGLLKNFLKDKGISLKEFLTNKRYVVIISSDETEDWQRYKRSGLIDLNFIVEEYDKSDDDIEYLEWLKEQEDEESDT